MELNSEFRKQADSRVGHDLNAKEEQRRPEAPQTVPAMGWSSLVQTHREPNSWRLLAFVYHKPWRKRNYLGMYFIRWEVHKQNHARLYFL